MRSVIGDYARSLLVPKRKRDPVEDVICDWFERVDRARFNPWEAIAAKHRAKDALAEACIFNEPARLVKPEADVPPYDPRGVLPEMAAQFTLGRV